MLTCKRVAKSLADGDYAELPRLKRLGLRLHVLLCLVCGRYHRQLMRFQDALRRYRRSEDSRTAPAGGELRLREEEREAIRKALGPARERSDGEEETRA